MGGKKNSTKNHKNCGWCHGAFWFQLRWPSDKQTERRNSYDAIPTEERREGAKDPGAAWDSAPSSIPHRRQQRFGEGPFSAGLPHCKGDSLRSVHEARRQVRLLVLLHDFHVLLLLWVHTCVLNLYTAGGGGWAGGLAGVCCQWCRAREASWLLPSMQGDWPQHYSLQGSGHWWDHSHRGVPGSQHQHDSGVGSFPAMKKRTLSFWSCSVVLKLRSVTVCVQGGLCWHLKAP